jgi:vitamin B12 transporter
VRHLLRIALVIALMAGPAAAQRADPPPVLDPVVVTSTRIATPAGEVGSTTSVITRQEIDALAPSSVAEALRQVPGLHIDQPGGRGSVSSVYLRGGDPNFSVVLIDGVKVNDPTNTRGGSFDFSLLDPAAIERIEVLRGPLSAVYGSSALSGVINIVTRTGAIPPTLTLSGEADTDGSYRVAGSGQAGLGESSLFSLTTTHSQTGPRVEDRSFRGLNVAGRADLLRGADRNLALTVYATDTRQESFPDDSGGPRYATLRDLDRRESEKISLGMAFDDRLAESWTYTVRATYYRSEEDASSPGVAPGVRDPFGIPPNSSDSLFWRAGLLVNNSLTLAEGVRVAIGVETEFEEGRSRDLLVVFGTPLPGRFALSRWIVGPFVEGQVQLPFGLTVNGGVRVDVSDAAPAHPSPRLGGSYRIAATGTLIRGSWGRGFKLPSFFALGNPVVGNPDLKPETSEGFELGVSQPLPPLRATFDGTAFATRYANVVDLDEGPPPRLVNRSEVTAHGFELGATVTPIDRLTARGHVTYTETDIADTSEHLRNRPRWRGGATVMWRATDALRLSGQVLYVGRVFDSSIPTGDRTLDRYVRVDVAGSFQVARQWAIDVGIDNLLDTAYEDAVGFPAPGVTLRAGLRASF